MTNVHVSVIVSMYNSQGYLERCLESLASQSYRDFEVICVDDASADSSAEIARSFVQRDGRFRLLRHDENRGPGGAFNTGLEAAEGHYVTAVDSDDTVTPDMLEVLSAESMHGSADVVMAGYREVTADSEPAGTVYRPSADFRNVHDRTPDLFRTSNQIAGRLWLRRLFIDHGIRCPERVVHNDMTTTPQVLHFVRSVGLTDRIVYNYTRRPGSASRSFSERRIESYVAGFTKVRDFLVEQGVQRERSSAFHGWVCNNLSYGLRESGLALASDGDFRRGVAALLRVKSQFVAPGPGGSADDGFLERAEAVVGLEDFVSVVGGASFPGRALPSARGVLVERGRVAQSGRHGSGMVTFGPYLTLRAGRYRVSLDYIAWGRGNRWELTAGAGAECLAAGPLPADRREASFEVDLHAHRRDLEVRTFVGRTCTLAVEGARFSSIPRTSR